MGRQGFFTRLRNLLRGRGAAPASYGMISCREALERLFEFLDGELDEIAAKQVEEHLRVCERCYPHLVFEQSFRTAVRRAFRGERAPEEVRTRILEVIHSAGGEARS